MNRDFIEARIDAVLSNAKVEWGRELAEIKAQMGVKGQFGGSDSVLAGLKSFTRQLDRAVDGLLTEFAAGIETRGRLWHFAHQKLFEAIRPFCEPIERENLTQMARGSGYESLTALYLPKAIIDAEAKVVTHQAGWNAPKPEPWHKRHAFWLAAAGALAAYIAGLYSDSVRSALDGALGIAPVEQPCPLPSPQGG